MKNYMKWMKKSGGKLNENSLVGWINADEFVTGLKAAGPSFTQAKVIAATNALTKYTAGGLVPAINWTKAHHDRRRRASRSRRWSTGSSSRCSASRGSRSCASRRPSRRCRRTPQVSS